MVTCNSVPLETPSVSASTLQMQKRSLVAGEQLQCAVASTSPCPLVSKREDSACHPFCRKDVEKFSGADLLVRRAAIKRVQQSLIIRLVAIEFSHITELAPKNAKKHRSLQIMCQQMPTFSRPSSHSSARIQIEGLEFLVPKCWKNCHLQLVIIMSSMTSHIIHLIDIITLDLHFGGVGVKLRRIVSPNYTWDKCCIWVILGHS